MQKIVITTCESQAENKAFRSFLESLPNTFDYIGKEVHYARNVLKIIDAKGFGIEGMEQVMVKRYHGLFWFQKIDYTFLRKPKCRKAFDNTAELRRRGFEAAEQLACVEVWNHGLFQYAFFVSAVAKGERLDNLVVRLQEQGAKATIDQLIRQYATLVKDLHEHGVLYWDMNCGNVICRQDKADGDWQFTLIDTNRVRFFPPEQALDLETVIGDLILMNPKMGTVEQFIGEYLRQRGLYSEEEVHRIREVQRQRYERKRPIKKALKRFKKKYYKWLDG